MSLDLRQLDCLKGQAANAIVEARLCSCLLEQGFDRLCGISAGMNADWASSTAVAADSPVLNVKDKDVTVH